MIKKTYIGQQHFNPDSIYVFTQWSDKRHKHRANRLLYIQKTWRIKKLYKLHIWKENKWIFSSLASSCCIFRSLFPFPPWWGLSKRPLSSKPIEPSKIVLQFWNGEKQTLQMKLCSVFCHEQGCYKRPSNIERWRGLPSWNKLNQTHQSMENLPAWYDLYRSKIS